MEANSNLENGSMEPINVSAVEFTVYKKDTTNQ